MEQTDEGMDIIGRWIASRHSHVGDSHKGVPSSSHAPTVASSLKDGAADRIWQDSWAGHHQLHMPTHDLELSRSGDLLQMLMRTYNIIGVSEEIMSRGLLANNISSFDQL